MSSNNEYPKVIFKAELVERDGKKQVVVQLNSKHIPTLDYIASELRYNITELRAMEKTKRELDKQQIIKGSSHKLVDFLRRGHKR